MNTDIKEVYVITDRDPQSEPIWTRVGIAFVNRDQSLNVVLDAIPVNGRLHIRDKKIFPKKQGVKE